MNFRLNKRILSTVMVFLVIVAVIGVNFLFSVLSTKMNLNIDLTKEKILEFSDLTKETIKNLETDVRIKSLIPAGSYDNYGIFDSIDLLLKKYDSASDKISYEVIDIAKDPTVFQKYKDNKGNNAPEYSIIFESDKGYEVVDTLNIFEVHSTSESDPSKQVALFGGEQMFTTALFLAAGSEKSVVYVVEGHGEYAMEFELGDKAGSAAYIEYMLEGQPFDVKALDLLKSDVPSDADLVMVMAPQNDFTDAEIEKLDKYLSKGGDAVFIASVFNIHLNTQNLDEYYSEYGISFSKGLMGENDESKYQQLNGAYYLMPTVLDADITSAIKSSNARVVTSTSRGIKTENVKNVTFQSVLSSSDKAYIYDGVDFKETGKTDYATLVTKINEDTSKTKILFLDSPGYIDPMVLMETAYANQDFFINSVKYLTESTSSLAIVPKDVTPSILAIDASQAKIYSWIVIVVVPAIILACGLVVWIRRKNK